MKPSRFLPVINLIGCALITGVIVAQWLKERGLDRRIEALTHEAAEVHKQYDAEHERATALERDVAQLKEAVESTVKAKQQAEEAIAKSLAERDTQATQLATAAQEQAQKWQTALTERDERLRTLNAELLATRKRLDEAVARIKEADSH